MITVSCQEPLTIELAGEFDISNVDQLRAVVSCSVDRADVAVDALEVTFASAALLGCLIELSLHLATAGHEVELRRPSPVMYRLLQLTDTTEMFTLGPARG